MSFLEKDDIKIGEYLRSVILKQYESIRKFCIAYLELRDGETNNEEIRKLLNRFSQILKGKKRIQIDDLPFITELLCISCEEVLSAGAQHVPVGSHVTNYQIAASHDREMWDHYMKREDKLFLNCDEYCKSVIDYALDFKNYDFIKYLMEEKFIWFVDMSEWKHFGFSYGAGTSVKRRDLGYIDTSTPLELQYQDELRTRTIALAIENEDYDILDSLLAREVPEMHQVHIIDNSNVDFQVHRNDDVIRAVAFSNDKIIDYYSQEFTIRDSCKPNEKGNTFLFPYLDAVITTMLKNNKNDSAELLIRRALKHNKSALSDLKKLIDKSLANYKKYLGIESQDQNMDSDLKKQILYDFCFNPNSNLVSYFYAPEKHKYEGFVTNIIHVETNYGSPLIQELLNELNSTFEEIVALKGGEE